MWQIEDIHIFIKTYFKYKYYVLENRKVAGRFYSNGRQFEEVVAIIYLNGWPEKCG